MTGNAFWETVREWPLVYIQWVDSFGCGASWGHIADLPDVEHFCYSVGWLVHDGDKVKILVPHISPENKEIGAENSGCGDMTIPVSAIKEIRHLKATADLPAGSGKEQSNDRFN